VGSGAKGSVSLAHAVRWTSGCLNVGWQAIGIAGRYLDIALHSNCVAAEKEG
jgi:hypothetical protein